MSFPRPRKARTRIALAGAALSGVLLLLLGAGTRTMMQQRTFHDIDEELRTLAIAVGSDFEMEGFGHQESLGKGLEANVFEFRLQNHSAILFVEDRMLAVSGDLVCQCTTEPQSLGSDVLDRFAGGWSVDFQAKTGINAHHYLYDSWRDREPWTGGPGLIGARLTRR